MITVQEIEDFLRKLNVDGRPASGKSRNNYRAAIGTLFYFTESCRYVTNASEDIESIAVAKERIRLTFRQIMQRILTPYNIRDGWRINNILTLAGQNRVNGQLSKAIFP